MFTAKDHKTWNILFTRQRKNIEQFASKEFLEGFKRLDLPDDHIPSVTWLNARIRTVSDWRIVRTPVRYLSDTQWATHMSRKEFPITNFLRKRSELDFTPEPDIFHDIVGHIPMLMNPKLVEILDVFSHAYSHTHARHLETIAQLWWNTIEFSLIREGDDIKVFGAGLMSSFGEIGQVEKRETKTQAFTVQKGISKQRAVSSFHPTLLIIPSPKKLKAQLTKFFESLSEKEHI